MNPFTDEHLKRLKEKLESQKKFNSDIVIAVLEDDLETLLARLEAAEKVCELADHTNYCKSNFEEGPCNCELPDEKEAWRKAAGRE